MKAGKKFVSVRVAAKIMGVTTPSVHAWALEGRLGYKEWISPRTGRVERFILKSSLKRAKIGKCRFCGKEFRARRPNRAQFCCSSHRYKYRYRQSIAGKK
jgi:hypothetical protein